MPIPLPPPPPPYVAPDLRPIASSDVARLTFLRDAVTGRVRDVSFDSGVWIAAEGAPLEVRMHRREDGSIWAEQATYVDGDRMEGFARMGASARVEPISQRLVGGLGTLRNFVHYTVRNADGTKLREWSAGQCGIPEASRLDRVGAPEDPTFPSSWDDCFGGSSGTYVLGRMVALDRGWATRAQTDTPRLTPLPAGRYRLEVDVDPLDALADSNRANDTTTIPLVVRTVRVRRSGGPAPEPGTLTPLTPVVPASSATATSDARLRRLEHHVAARVTSRAFAEPTAAPADVDLPDLRNAPSYGFDVSTRKLKNGKQRDLLSFGSLTWNAGPGRLEVEAFRETGTILTAYQVFQRDGERTARQQRGTMVWHDAPGHNHFHFHSFAHYQLTTFDGAVIRDAGKRSWCIVDTDLVDTTRPGTSPSTLQFGPGGCGMDSGALWARLSLSVGSGDYYGPGTSGQTFDISTLPNGLYRIRLEANPSRVIAEADYDNNVSSRIIRLGGTPGARRVFPRPVPTLNERSSPGLEPTDPCIDC